MPSKRETMIFPFRWFETLTELEDNELRAMLTAIGAYAATGEAPEFKGAMKALWNEIRQRIDRDREQYEAGCQRNRDKALKRWNSAMPRHTTAYHGIQQHADACHAMPDDAGNADADADNKTEISDDKSSSISPETPDFFGVTGAETKPKRKTRNADSGIFFDYEGDRRLHGVSEEQLRMWQEFYDGLDVETELRNASAWLDANRRKIDIKAFLVNWLKRAQDRSRSNVNAAIPRYGKQPIDFDAVRATVARMREEENQNDA